MNKKVALVTGASQGIGKGIAKELATNGYITYVTYLKNRDKGKETVKEIETAAGQAILVQLDVRSQESVKKAFDQIKQEQGRLNVLVNNAAIDILKSIETIAFQEWQDVVDTKINGNFLCTKYALPLMKNQDNPNVIIITSSLGDRPDTDDPSYCVGTAGTIAFVKSMALYLSRYGIRTNAISPGETRTGMWDNIEGVDDGFWKRTAKNNPMGKIATPKAIATATMMIINDKTRFLNGNFIYVNGGGHLK
ncbi:SDR family oxidoreductase [Patescibacteria group bacterium]|nr:SDR family oxidoreductase [Patescibacteria group bacterium]MCL5091467.1 SDR family oxidoreductase [Patescibacteria group bacterium]